MHVLFLIIARLSLLAVVIFITLAIVQFAKKDSIKGKKQIKFAGISVAVLFASLIVLGSTTETSKDNKKMETADIDEPKENKIVETSGESTDVEKDAELEEELKNDPEYQKLLAKQQFLSDLNSVIESDEKLAFDKGDYIQGDIQEGDYAFFSYNDNGAQYYSEKDKNGEIVANENFDSFGYVHVNETGNISNGGLLLSVSAFEKLNVSGSKELFEMMTEKTDYTDSGYYKVGADIPAGSYVLESNGDGYVAVMSGPVGNSKIVTNENFNGKYQVNVKDGQYLKIHKATISQQ